MRVLAPGFEARVVELRDVRAGVAWTERADPLVRARVEETIARFPHARRLELPDAAPTYRLFMREVADVHRELFTEQADSYGENVRPKIERCLEVSEAEADAAARTRADLRDAYAEAAVDVDVVLTPTVPMVAPLADADELGFRARGISLTYPFNCVGWPALALPCGEAEDGLPASVQIVGRPGADALVLAVGASLVRGTPTA
jgi:Asp-tRNA(Asn)/Glu-tRNA(Gln) amidotransferase A subunit family amidase